MLNWQVERSPASDCYFAFGGLHGEENDLVDTG
jgi:hypothetical protein